jgi:ABC-2 type transport system ATP-binding protein
VAEPVLDIEHLSKRYGSIQAVDDFSLQVPQGAVYGFLGPNGSGKTTLLGILLGAILPNKGSYKWFGKEKNHAELRRSIGSLLEQPNFYPYLSGWQNLKITATIKGVVFSDIDRVLELVGLKERQNSRFKTYSTGMKQRLAIGAALLGDPEVLVLDEPSGGLDPQGMAEMRQLILDLAAQDKTILLASHLLDEVEKVCSHVAIVHEGKLRSSGRVKEVLGGGNLVEVAAEDQDKLKSTLQQHEQVQEVEEHPEYLLATVDKSLTPAKLNQYLVEQGIYLSHLSYQQQSLEDHFLQILEQEEKA